MQYSRNEPIAIVGSACRFPGEASKPSKLWELLREPRDVVSQFTPDRLNLTAFYDENGEHHGSTNVRNQSYLLNEDIRQFDAGFFNINPREADALDPQQRNLLETVYESLESAGWPLEQVQGSQMSVFVGLMTSDWHDIQVRDPETAPTYAATGTARSIMSNRISYFFDLHGPSVTIDTACSSSLVALHQAVQAIRNGESPTAVVAGANLILDPWMYIAESTLHMLSPNSRSRMWDKNADGYARGEGFGAIILKSLSQAIKDGDHIEAVVRETGVNSDGRTKGITMPSSSAQSALIRQTYQRAGLDPLTDGCQYFECHGTGTPAGDPVEAEALHKAFFPESRITSDDDVLYVGSIKTVVGHLEGTAGLAGVLKAALAVQHKIIPPNLHFEELNPAIKPFYDHLCVPTTAIPWPETKDGIRRASVNSFGFGGTNAHAIIENYVEEEQARGETEATDRFVGPLVFSSQSELSLKSMIREYAKYIHENTSVSMHDLSWILDRRRSTLPVKAFFSGSTRGKVQQYLNKAVSEFDKGAGDELLHRSRLLYPGEMPGILGIFTGQGAQWATMATNLIQQSPIFRSAIERQQRSLDQLPDGPSWRIAEELMAPAAASRIGEAAFSQPLCTAIQVGMYDLLAAADVHLDAVVGHSSGEIAAVYAAGMITAEDAIRIAYYRGVYAKLASGLNGQPGGMLAVGMSLENAQEFCNQLSFKDRLCVAASNSAASVTLSGDRDAVDEAKAKFDEEKTFARVLIVDTAYHSHHMIPCAEAYLESLKACNIKVQKPRAGTHWISSVRGDPDLVDENRLEDLASGYWVDNMVKPVLFSQAVERSCWTGGPFELALEIGAHPALKGPAMQTIKSVTGQALPYASLMRRGDDEVEAFAGGMGYLWQHLGPSFVNLTGFREAFAADGSERVPKMLKDLPTYPWEHTRIAWKESRISRAYRLGKSQAHPLLGRQVPDSWDQELRWRNVIRTSDLPWVKGHVFQGQVLFPAAGYITMAIEAASIAAGDRNIRTIEIQDFEIPKALVIDEDSDGVETIFVLHQDVHATKGESSISANFSCYACRDEVSGAVERTSCGKIHVLLGESSFDELPRQPQIKRNLTPIDMDQFYENLESLGLNYQGLFRGLQKGGRVEGMAQVEGSWLAADIGRDFVVHPAFLDVGFHAVFCAFSAPGTGHLWAPYLPISIRSLTIDPNVSFMEGPDEIKVTTHGFATEKTASILDSEVQMYNAAGRCGICAEGLGLRAMYAADESTDRALFIENIWKADISNKLDYVVDNETHEELDAIEATERLCLHYWQSLLREIKPGEREKLQWFHKLQLSAASKFLARVEQGEHPYVKPEWLNTSPEQIRAFKDQLPDAVDLQLARVVGEALPSVLRGEVSLLERMLDNDLLNQFYMRGLGLDRLNNYIGAAMTQIVHRYPRCKILEIGAGTGGTTRSIFDSIGDKFASYMYTDISAGFFEKASEKFKEQRSKMTFKMLDIEKDPTSQGQEAHTYDIIVAANVLHATAKLKETMEHTRKLLRPGGFLVMMEVTGEMARLSFIMGGLPGWWLGADEGRVLSPGISVEEWEDMLQQTGFSGVSHVVHDTTDPDRHACSLIVTQATDATFNLVREPFAADLSLEGPLVLVSGKGSLASRINRETKNFLNQYRRRLQVVENFDALASKTLPPTSSVMVLEELDKPLLSLPVSDTRLRAFKSIFASAKDILWVTTGRTNVSPQHNMAVGILRTMRDEIPGLNVQSLDFAEKGEVSAFACADAFLRLVAANSTSFVDHNALWTVEPELVVKDNSLLIPRLRPNVAANQRYNAARRPIVEQVDLAQVRAVLASVEGRLVVRQAGDITNELHIDVRKTIVLPGIETGRRFLCEGDLNDGSGRAIALSTQLASCEYVGKDDYLVLGDTRREQDLQVISEHFISRLILAYAAGCSGTVLLLDPPLGIADILQTVYKAESSKIHFAGSKDVQGHSGWISIHPKSTQRALKSMLPQDFDTLVAFSGSLSDATRLSRIMNCSVTSLAAIVDSATSIIQVLSETINELTDVSSSNEAPTATVNELAGAAESMLESPKIITWSACNPVKAMISPLDATKSFKEDRSYLLVGLTGDLGQSLCRFMVQNGAKHIVLTSRNADPRASWLAELNGKGANVTIQKLDVTDRAAVRLLVGNMEKNLPPIAGVCNGAMVLIDSTLESMSPEAMNAVLQPKVQGSLILDEIFSKYSLDFFVLFSSMGTVLGNAGQSNYNAANLFMTGLAAHRKSRGLAGSVIDIGFVTDVGYVARQARHIGDRLRNDFWEPLSEKDVRQMFAEAIIAGKPENSASGQVSMGIKPFFDSPNATTRPKWYANPRFAQMVKDSTTQDSTRSVSTGKVNIKQQLEEATSEDEAAGALISAFSTKLEQTLQLNPGTVRPELPLLDAGVDSLLAVEVRTWFLREINVDVPVLKALSGDTISEICTEAASKFLAANSSTHPSNLAKPMESCKVDTSVPSNSLAEKRRASSSTDGASISGHADNHDVTSQERSRSVHKHGFTAVSDISRGTSVAPTPWSITRSVTPMTEPDHDEISTRKDLETPVQFSRYESMSLAQSRLWFLHELLEDKTTYNVAVTYRIGGPLQAARFKRALATTIAHHDALRTALFRDEHTGQPQQAVRSTPLFNFSHIQGDEVEVSAAFKSYQNHAWALERGDVVGATLITHSPDSHTAVFGYHHVAIDGFSWGIFLQNLSEAYQGKHLAAVRKHCSDFAVDEAKRLELGHHESDIAFWKEEFATLPSSMPLLPFARTSARQEMSYDSNTISREISKDLTANIKHASQMCRVSPFHFYLAAIEILYSKFTGIEKMCLGITDANRANPEFASTIGFFLNFLPLNFLVNPSDSFAEVAKRTQKKIYDGLAHSSVPFEHVLDELKVPRSATEPPLFQAVVNYRVASVIEIALDNSIMTADYGDDAKNPYDMAWNITESTEGKALLELTSREYLYSKSETQLVMDAFVRLLEHFSRKYSGKIETATLYDMNDAKRSLALARGPRTESSWPSNLSARFMNTADQFPRTIAIKDGTSSISYSQLKNTVQSIAANLEKLPIGTRVAVLCQPSVHLVAALLGILHAGLVYVPLDLSLPSARHATILKSSEVQFVLHEDSTTSAARDLATQTGVELMNGSSVSLFQQDIPCRASADSAAILLHTSGSTGTPKGIELTQAGCANFVAGLVKRLNLGTEVVLQQTSLGFDLSLAQIFVALGEGGTLIMVPQDSRGDVVKIASLMQDEGVTLTGQTPSEYQVMLQYAGNTLRNCKDWRTAILGGELVSKQLRSGLKRLGLEHLRAFNIYGPTETTIATSIEEITQKEDQQEDIELLRSVGYTCDNYSIYVLDESFRPVPVGYPGQICIGGAGVSMGYPALVALTSQKFRKDQFALPEDLHRGWDRMYCTGDRGKILADGRVIFLGRMDGDTQIKLRGVRMELDEIAHSIYRASNGRIAQAVVTVRGDMQFLAAHVVLEQGQDLSGKELEEILEQLPVPRYMRPSVIVPLSSLPITTNGKIDRAAIARLPLPENLATTTQEPLTLSEGDLRLIWEDVLQLHESGQRIGPHDDFFSKGGNSLLLVKLQRAILESMGLSIPVRELYAASTLRDMSNRITTNKESIPHQNIDWISETCIRPDELPSIKPLNKERKWSGFQVLITGATGFLGSHVLSALLDDPEISRVHAIAVDPIRNITVPSCKKLMVYHGSLLHDQVGLTDTEMEFLKREVDIIFHAGAIGHCMNNFASVRSANFLSTRFLAKMAAESAIPFHFLSSPRVPLLTGNCHVRQESVSSILPPNDGSQGFMVSKWASERFLELFAQQSGLQVTIHRACAPVGDKAPAEDAINALLLFSQKLRATPVFDNVVGFFDFEDAAKLGGSIVKWLKDSEQERNLRFVHHSSNTQVPIKQIAARLGSVFGGTFEELPLDEWLSRARGLGIEDMVASYLEAAIQKGETIAFPYLGK